MIETFVQSKAAREQEWEGACADEKYDLAESIATYQLSRLPTDAQLEAIKTASLGGFDITADAMRLRIQLETTLSRHAQNNESFDPSLLDHLDFLDELID